ncbi:MAG: hypothetical protein P1V97_27820, partial [Planctomycetota bacterium]|nr:hypothetical protein [Planctomycetota bacterium]
LAEVARQVGHRKKKGKGSKDRLRYKRELRALAPTDGMTLSLEDLIEWDDRLAIQTHDNQALQSSRKNISPS